VAQEEAPIIRRQIEGGGKFRRRVDALWEACEQWADAGLEPGERTAEAAEKKLSTRNQTEIQSKDAALLRGSGWDLEAMEMAVRRQALRVAAMVLERHLNADRSDYTGPQRQCSRGGQARYLDRREKTFQSVHGPLRLERAYYHCSHCGEASYPRDETLGLCWQAGGRERENARAIKRAASGDTNRKLSEIAQRGEREAIRRNFGDVQPKVVIGDGAPWIWNIAEKPFPDAIQIVDRFQVKEILILTRVLVSSPRYNQN